MGISSFFDYSDSETDDQPGGLALLPQWRDSDWARLLAHTAARRFGAGEVVIDAGAEERALYIVSTGVLEILAGPYGPTRKDGRRPRRLALAGPGSVVGELAFFDGLPRSATVRGLTDGELLRLSLQAFEVFAARESELARELLFDLARLLSLRLRDTNAFVVQSAG